MRTLPLCFLIAYLLCTPLIAQKKVKKLDITKPEDAVKASRKITASLRDGEECVFWWEGNVYSRIPGERDRLLFTYQGMNIRATKTFYDSAKGYGYRHVSREVLFYMDPQTKQVLRTWRNPFTGKEVEVVHVANDPVNARSVTYAIDNGKPYRLPGRFIDGTYLQSSEVPLFYTNPLGGDYQEYNGGTYHAMEIFNFAVDEEELLNAEKHTAENVTIAWTRISKWLPWMEMGDRIGYLIFSGNGKKLKSFEQMPEEIKKEIRTNYSLYEHAPPLDDTRPNETSWTVFKKYIDKKRAEQTDKK
ncbi:MAG: DUF1838 family protein [Bacteroidota bacterium]|nr:DUF1838 domain-containing protein [Candidatus Kapabacteria bacterium]MDW8219222.1 DUF1838 family protein [Bacteroidota bacterium]